MPTVPVPGSATLFASGGENYFIHFPYYRSKVRTERSYADNDKK